MPPDWLDLKDGEEVRLETHPSRWLMLREFLLLVVVTVVIGAVRWSDVLSGFAPGGVPLETIILIAIPLAALPLVGDWINRISTSYVITDDQVWKKSGILNRSIDPLGLEEIVDIEIEEDLGDRVLGKGEVVIATAAEGDFAMKFEHVPNPSDVAGELRRAKDDAEG